MVLTKAKDFKIIDFPFKPDFPVKPNKRFNVAIAGIISLMFGIILAFFIEFWQSSKQKNFAGEASGKEIL